MGVSLPVAAGSGSTRAAPRAAGVAAIRSRSFTQKGWWTWRGNAPATRRVKTAGLNFSNFKPSIYLGSTLKTVSDQIGCREPFGRSTSCVQFNQVLAGRTSIHRCRRAGGNQAKPVWSVARAYRLTGGLGIYLKLFVIMALMRPLPSRTDRTSTQDIETYSCKRGARLGQSTTHAKVRSAILGG
jgi:hypothetical protein